MKKYILIADPSKVSRFVLERYLSEKYNIMPASSYSEAVNWLTLAKPSLIIVSYELQDGLGYDLCKYVHENYKNIPVIIISSYEDDNRRKKAFEVGAIDFLIKSKVDEGIIKHIDEIVEIINLSDISGCSAYIISEEGREGYFPDNVLSSTGVKVKLFSEPHRMMNELKTETPDIIISDIYLRDIDGIELIKEIRKNKLYKNIPVLVQTNTRESALLRTLFLFGANDYILKPYSPEELILRVTSSIKSKKLYDSLEETNRELFKKATTDPLTELYNRRYIMEQLQYIYYNFIRYGNAFAVILFDLDYFKNINDTYGHDVGDIVLIEFSKVLKDSLRKTDVVGRFGGEEFIAIVPNISEINIDKLVLKLLTNIRETTINVVQGMLHVSASIGVALSTNNDTGIDYLIKRSDDLMYLAKNSGRDRACISSGDRTYELS